MYGTPASVRPMAVLSARRASASLGVSRGPRPPLRAAPWRARCCCRNRPVRRSRPSPAPADRRAVDAPLAPAQARAARPRPLARGAQMAASSATERAKAGRRSSRVRGMVGWSNSSWLGMVEANKRVWRFGSRAACGRRRDSVTWGRGGASGEAQEGPYPSGARERKLGKRSARWKAEYSAAWWRSGTGGAEPGEDVSVPRAFASATGA